MDVREVAGRHGEDRAGAGADRPRHRRVLDAGEGRGGDRRRRKHAGLARDAARDRARRRVRADRPLPVERHAADGARGHRPERVTDEEEHRGEQRDRGRERHEPRGGTTGGTHEPDDCELCERAHDRLRSSRTTAVVQLDRATEARGDVGVVRRDDEREAELGLQRLDQVEHALARVGVEMAGRLVAEQQLGPLGERARDRDALRLAAGELRPAGSPPSTRGRRARAARAGASSRPRCETGPRRRRSRTR